MEGNMVSFMGSLVYDWLLNMGNKKLAKKFKRKAETVVNGSAKKVKRDESSSDDSSDGQAPAAKPAFSKANPIKTEVDEFSANDCTDVEDEKPVAKPAAVKSGAAKHVSAAAKEG